jgi:hypothetical protein
MGYQFFSLLLSYPLFLKCQSLWIFFIAEITRAGSRREEWLLLEIGSRNRSLCAHRNPIDPSWRVWLSFPEESLQAK